MAVSAHLRWRDPDTTFLALRAAPERIFSSRIRYGESKYAKAKIPMMVRQETVQETNPSHARRKAMDQANPKKAPHKISLPV